MDRFSVAGKHIAITGASSGFGHHFAGVLAREGARVSLGARRMEKIQARVDELQGEGHTAFGSPLDVCDRSSMEAFFASVEAELGPVDVLINNAGIEAGAKTYTMIDEDDWDAVIDTNLKSAWLMSKLYTERVVANEQRNGNIVMISSITDRRTIKGQFPYAISKGGVTRMTKALALEAARYGIRVNALAPGYIPTNVSRLVVEGETATDFVKSIPMRRFGEFEDLDGPLLLLTSDASRWMNGSIVVVDGGHVCASL